MPGAGTPFIRLYMDEDVHKGVAVALRLRDFDVVSAHEHGRWGMTDEEQLVYAAAQGRALFSFNAADYLRLHGEWMQARRTHWGVIVSRQLPVGETTRRLLQLLNRITADEMRNQCFWLPGYELPA